MRDIKLREQRVEILAMLDEAIAVRAAVRQLLGIPHADQVRRNAAPKALGVGDDVPPEVAGRRVAVQKDDGISIGIARLDIGHATAVHLGELFLCPGHATSLSRGKIRE